MNVIEPDAGNYRYHGIRIMGTDVPITNYLKISELMKELARDMNKKPKRDALGCSQALPRQIDFVKEFSSSN